MDADRLALVNMWLRYFTCILTACMHVLPNLGWLLGCRHVSEMLVCISCVFIHSRVSPLQLALVHRRVMGDLQLIEVVLDLCVYTLCIVNASRFSNL